LKFFRIRNWEKYQHYKDRFPPWIKLHRGILREHKYFILTEIERCHLVGLFLVAAETGNKIPNDQQWLRVQLSTSKPVNLDRLVDTEWLEWMEQDASNVLADCKQPDSDTLASRVPARYVSPSVSSSASVPGKGDAGENPEKLTFGEFGNVRLTAEEHEKLVQKLNGAHESYINRLDRWGAEQPAKFRQRKNHYATILTWYDRDGKEGKLPARKETPEEARARLTREYEQKLQRR
jgi:hypothetical protein